MFSNRYVQRRVAADAARACFVCHRPTPSVLVNEDADKDFFYACDAHLQDAGFAQQDPGTRKQIEQQEARRQQFLELKALWEAKQKEVETSGGEKDTKEAKSDASVTDTDEKGALKKAKAVAAAAPAAPTAPQETRIRPVYVLNRGVHNMRLQHHRQAAQQQRSQQLLATPDLFPAVPTHKPSARQPE